MIEVFVVMIVDGGMGDKLVKGVMIMCFLLMVSMMIKVIIFGIYINVL